MDEKQNQQPSPDGQSIPVPPQLLSLRKKGLWWKLLCCVLAVMLLWGAGALWLWHSNEFRLELTMMGSQEITLEYGESFTDPGAAAQVYGTLLHTEPEAVEVEVRSTVDPARLGTYEVLYKAQKILDFPVGRLVLEDSCVRVVHVVDTQAPQIQLYTDPEAFTLPGGVYEEEGFRAVDNYDGDLTDRVIRQVRGDRVFYQVADSSGNRAEVSRRILYADILPPELTLAGEQTVIVLKGETYREPGYLAIDNCDGEITGKVVVEGTVDPGTLGTYTLTYTVTDSYGNTAAAERTVIVRNYLTLPDMPLGDYQTPVNPGKKVVYLTFDDGPGPYTEALLDVLEKYNVKATFFVVNRGYYNLLERMAEEGHTVAMHCNSHQYSSIYTDEDAYFSDLKEIQNVILKKTGQLSTIVRFPGGSSNSVSISYCEGIMTRLTAMLKDMGYRYFDWNVDSRDAGGATTAEEVYLNVINGISQNDIAVVLQHDIKQFSVNAVEKIIQWGLKNGYTFLALDTSSPTCESKLRN